MSIDLITEVRRRLDVSGGELLVAIEIADAANEHGAGVFVGVSRMADRSRQDPRTVQRQLKHLIEIGWLEVVKRGGGRRADGSGIPTLYRISSAWVKGDKLPGLPDYQPKFYEQDKGDNLSPLDESYGDKQGGSTVTKTPEKGDTAVSGDPLTRIPKEAHARAIPSGSRGAQSSKSNPEPPPFDEHVSRRHWWTHAVNHALGSGSALGIFAFGVRGLDDVPLYAREFLRPVLTELTEAAIAADRAAWPTTRARALEIASANESRINRELATLQPKTPAERSSAAA